MTLIGPLELEWSVLMAENLNFCFSWNWGYVLMELSSQTVMESKVLKKI